MRIRNRHKKVEKKDYGFDYLHLTGPRLFGDAFHTIDLLPNSYTTVLPRAIGNGPQGLASDFLNVAVGITRTS